MESLEADALWKGSTGCVGCESARKGKRFIDIEFSEMTLSKRVLHDTTLVMGNVEYSLLEYDGPEGKESTA